MTDAIPIATLPAPICAWENEGGAPSAGPTAADALAASEGPQPSHALATLGAVLAVWPDLSPAIRMRLTGAVVAAMGCQPPPAGPAH